MKSAKYIFITSPNERETILNLQIEGEEKLNRYHLTPGQTINLVRDGANSFSREVMRRAER